MPELPEVYTFQQYFNTHALKKKIKRCHFHRSKILMDISPEDFESKLINQSFISSYRRGKYLFPELDNGKHILIHFGMTGDLSAYHFPDEAPKYERMFFAFQDQSFLGYDDLRLFGKIRYIPDLAAYIDSISLGEDALTITEDSFLATWSSGTGNIKAFLMNQKNIAGLGNLYVDEICFQTRIDPRSQLKEIPLHKAKEVYKSMKKILEYAVDVLPDYKEYPENWFWEWRKEGTKSPDGKTLIQKAKVAGRTTYFYEAWQKLY